MSVDSNGRLYVAGAPGIYDGVATFAPNCGREGTVYIEDFGNPQDPVADDGHLFLTTINDGSMPAIILVYKLGSGSAPISQLTDVNNGLGLGLAVDSHHNLFWSTTNYFSGGGQVIEFRKERMPGYLLKATSIGSDYPGGVLVDKSDHLLLLDQSVAKMYRYAPPYDKPPTEKITLRGPAEYCALGMNDERLYCLDYQYDSVDVYEYPNGKYLYNYTNGIEGSEGPVGIAVQPPASAPTTRK